MEKKGISAVTNTAVMEEFKKKKTYRKQAPLLC